ncbi:hypothetical protein Cpir12675_001313 [Ceratocystis pirilliformis]|uniref:Uncharacterized protein n=1 Tax=Ceratocystis pirilliformis TaxID=259994 RepID=A0ABR3ZHF1_9PEZI
MMESDQPGFEGAKVSRRDRWKGKLFGKDRHGVVDESNVSNVNDFLNSTSDTLQVSHTTPSDIPSPGRLPNGFANGSSAPPPRALTRIDTVTAPRYPQAASVNSNSITSTDTNGNTQYHLSIRPNNQTQLQHQHSYHSAPDRSFGQLAPSPNVRSASLNYRRKKNKGLSVHFPDGAVAEVIGDGGDECDDPPSEVARNKQARIAAGRPTPAPFPAALRMQDDPDFQPRALKRNQTGFNSIPAPQYSEPSPPKRQPNPPAAQHAAPGCLESIRAPDLNRRSFIDTQQAEMRMDEGRALAKARAIMPNEVVAMSPSPPSSHYSSDASVVREVSPELPATSIYDHYLDSCKITAAENPPPPPAHAPRAKVSPPVAPSAPQSNYSPVSYTTRSPHMSGQAPNNLSRTTSAASQDRRYSAYTQNSHTRGSFDSPSSAVAPADSRELSAFVSRTKHLFELFRLHAETAGPLKYCELTDLARAALWWFLRGRQALEVLIRNRHKAAAQDQMQYTMEKQQAYANLSKAYWLCEEAVPEVTGLRNLSPHPEVEEVCASLRSSLRKLAISMSRNDFMPPEEAFLPQTTDKFIWVDYPQVPQDVLPVLTSSASTSLLGGSNRQQAPKPLTLVESLPLADTPDYFNFSRVIVDAVLFEQGSRESQGLSFRCFLSTVRPVHQPNLTFLVVSQNGNVQLRIQGTKGTGTTWDDVRWKPESNTIDIRLPRGFQLAIRCTSLDFRMLWNMYEYGMKMHSLLFPKTGENVVFRATLPSFQYFDSDPQSRAFPKEAISNCEIRLLENVYKEDAATGPRYHHRGFRLAIITGPKTRTLSGVSHTYPPGLPFQFGFLRGEKEAPALLVKFEGSRSRGSMVLSFKEEKERLRFHSIVVGSALNQETIFAEVAIKGYTISPRLMDKEGFAGLSNLAWKGVRVINDDSGEDIPTTVLADKLRILTDFMNGSVTDRVNVTPGELRIRMGVSDPTLFQILRLPQSDMTMAVAEAQVGKEIPGEMKIALDKIATGRSIRSFSFVDTRDLHSFIFALTGFRVLFDGVAASFAITRRRMVVPVHKKWEAGATRIVVVERDGVLQLLVFFETFHYGHCMGMVLKRTDEFEAFSRGGKVGIKILDAKFPLPRIPKEKDRERMELDGSADEMAFLCLDLPEIPGEHDDISIMFDAEDERTLLCSVLPASTKGLK